MPATVDEYLNITTRLRALPQLDGDPDGWLAVRRKLEVEVDRPHRRARVARYASAASLAALGLIAGLKLLEAPPSAGSVPDAAMVASALAEDRIETLRVRSQALEELLAAMPSRPAVERAGTTLPIESLEAEVQWLDHQMSLAGTIGEPAPEAERLWQDRVEVMNSLVQLRYVEAQRQVL